MIIYDESDNLIITSILTGLTCMLVFYVFNNYAYGINGAITYDTTLFKNVGNNALPSFDVIYIIHLLSV